MNKTGLGPWGEAQAAAYLRRRAYSILAMNYVCRFGEIDIVARRGAYVAFVEVKTRKDASFAAAREYVTAAKQRRIISAAALWLSENESPLQPRFDVIEVYAPQRPGGRPRIQHIANAFEAF